MSEVLKMSCPVTCEDLPSATSLPASESGAMPCAVQDGPTIDQSGPAAAPANLSARQAKEQGLLTSGTYGPLSSISSKSVTLQLSLVNRLVAKTASLGSTLFKLTWKARYTPSVYAISALRASVLRTFGKGCTSAASWPTPGVSDSLGGGSVDTVYKRMTGQKRPSGASVGAILRHEVLITRPKDFGGVQIGLTVLTTGRGQLNPAHSRWLMGLPAVWDDCADMVTRSVRRSRKASSKHTSK